MRARALVRLNPGARVTPPKASIKAGPEVDDGLGHTSSTTRAPLKLSRKSAKRESITKGRVDGFAKKKKKDKRKRCSAPRNHRFLPYSSDPVVRRAKADGLLIPAPKAQRATQLWCVRPTTNFTRPSGDPVSLTTYPETPTLRRSTRVNKGVNPVCPLFSSITDPV